LEEGIEEFRLTGGEPLLSPQFMRIIETIANAKRSATITTNGTLFSPQVIAQLSHLRDTIKTIWFSLYGADENDYEFITRQKGSFRLFRKNLEIMSREEMPIGINANVGFGKLSKWIVELSQLAEEHVEQFKIIWTAPNGRASNNWPHISCEPKRWIEVCSRIERLSSDYSMIEWRIEKSFLPGSKALTITGESLENMQCLLKRRSLLSVDMNGDLYPCCLLVGKKEYRLGNIGEKEIRQHLTHWQDQPTFSLLKKECFHYANIKERCDLDKQNLLPLCPLYLEKF
jgi:radical SAM protein with 4Fe4S-binding SPASM domain